MKWMCREVTGVDIAKGYSSSPLSFMLLWNASQSSVKWQHFTKFREETFLKAWLRAHMSLSRERIVLLPETNHVDCPR